MEEGWFVLSPNKVAEANENETAKSLGMPEKVDQEMFSEILTRVKSENVEFNYDVNYIDKEYKNHVSAQIGEPLLFESMDKVNNECEGMPESLKELFGEPVELHSCRITSLNERPIFQHVYTVPSYNLTIINEIVPVNQRYSIMFVGGSANDMDGLKRVRAMQDALLHAVTNFLKAQMESK